MLRQSKKQEDHDDHKSSIDRLPIAVFDIDDKRVDYVLILNAKACGETLDWIVETLLKNGLTLNIVSQIEEVSSKTHLPAEMILLVSCDYERIEQASRDVYMPQQLARQCDDPDKLSISEQQRVLLSLIEGIHLCERSCVVGMPSVTIYPKQSIVQICRRENIILNYFPLHDQDELNRLKENLFVKFTRDFDEVRKYFGETIGFYFAFLSYYQYLFIGLTPLSILAYYYGHLYGVLEGFTIVTCLSLFIYLKLWARYSNRLACEWGTIEAFQLDSARLDFKCKSIVKDAITDELVPYYPISKTWYKEYLISLPFVALSFYIAYWIMSLYFQLEDAMLAYYNCSQSFHANVLTYVPSISYALIVMIMNYAYRIVITKLNDFENHRTQMSHENHWIVKLVLFEFANNFMSLFYIAFRLGDIPMLRWNLLTMLIVNQTIDNILEITLPCAQVFLSREIKNMKKKKDLSARQTTILWEKQLESYTDTYYDYLELFVQFGYCFLFISIFPLGPLIAGINSIVESRIDAMKLCCFTQRPFPRSAKSINNAWMKSFETLAVVIVISNLMIMCNISPLISDLAQYWNSTPFYVIIYLEHIIFAFVLILWSVVPDIPKDIHLLMMRRKYANLKQVSNKSN